MYGCLLYREKAVVVTFEYIFILNSYLHVLITIILEFTQQRNSHIRVIITLN